MAQRIEVPGAGILEFPDGMSDAEMSAAIQKNFPQLKPQATSDQRLRASAPMRLVQGLRDPIDAGAQLAPFVLGGAATLGKGITSLGGLLPNPVSETLGKGADLAFSEFDRVNQGVKDAEQKLQAARTATGQTGFDGARLTGNVLSPANLALSPAVAPAASAVKAGATKMAIGGGVQGMAGGAMTPVEDAQSGADFAVKKGLQMATGGITGAVAGPIVGKLAEAVTPRVIAAFQRAPIEQRTAATFDSAMAQALEETGQKIDNIPKEVYDQLRKEVARGLKAGMMPNSAAALRQKDFQSLGIPATTGQLTRDPMQFAREQNLRAVPDVGTPLTQRFNEQDRLIAQQFRGFGGPNSMEQTPASNLLATSLKNADESMRKGVTAAYSQARQDAGKDIELPLQGLAQDYAATLERFADKIPAGVRNKFKSLGLEAGTKQKIYTPEEADDIIKVINDHVGADAATNRALDALRGAVKRSVTEAKVDDVFEPARAAASKRFKLQEAIPALEAAATGKVSPDDFVQRFVLDGKPTDVKNMALLLKKTDPKAFEEARNQLGAKLQRAAFGENVAGDKAGAQERFAAELRRIGSEKLSAFYTKEEIDKLQALSRVLAYVHSKPSGAPVMGNPNMAWAGNMLANQVGGKPLSMVANALGRLSGGMTQARDVNNALAAKLPNAAPDMTPEQLRTLVNVRRLAPFLAGGAAAASLGQ